MNGSSLLLGLVVAALVLTAREGVEGKTIDLGEAVLRQPPDVFHSDQTEDLFGYSGVLYHTGDPFTPPDLAGRLVGARLMIGVPNGTTEMHQLERTGLVFTCPLLQSGSGPCQPASEELYDTTDNMAVGEGGVVQEKRGQQMGFSMQSGERLVVCAPGWISVDGDTQRNQGRCISVDSDLTDPMQLRPCTVDGRGNTHNPAINNETADGFGQCFAGIAVDMLSDGTVVLGAPGAFLYTGTAVVNTNDVLAVSNDTDTPSLPDQGFLGMAIARGRILSRDSDSFVIGSSRGSGQRGQVRVMRADVVMVGSSTVLENVVTVLQGESVGAQFGTSLAAVDFNGDGFDEIVVGAPFFSNSARQAERGAVYMYINLGGTVSDSNRTRIVGTVNSARFGHALTALGDLDGDGYDELAVSAPYGEGLPGTVYIYSGDGSGVAELSQTIVGSDLNLQGALLSGLTSFGAFVEGGTDIDGNCHSDLVIGAFLSRKVFVLRSRSVVVLTASVTPNVTVLSVGTTHFSVNYCLQASGDCLTPDQAVEVNYTLYADRRDVPRVVFTDGAATLVGTFMLLVNAGTVTCVMQTARLQNANVDVQTVPINLSIDATVIQGDKPAEGDGMDVQTDLRTNRIYSRLVGNTSAELLGERECGLDNVCQFDLLFQSLTVTEPLSGQALLGFDNQVGVQAVVSSQGMEPAISPTVRFTFPQEMTYRRADPADSSTCSQPTSQPTGQSVDCILFGMIRPNTTVNITVFFGISNAASNLTGSNVSITAEILPPETSDVETNTLNNNGSVQFLVVAAADATVTTAQPDVVLSLLPNSPRTTTLPNTFEEIGRNVSISFTFLNEGPSMFSSGLVNVYVPYRSGCTRSPFLFYLADVTFANVTGTSAGNCSYSPRVDVLDLAGGSPEALMDVNLACVEGGRVNCSESSRCALVQCELNSVQSNDAASITLFGYVDDHHFSGTSEGTTLEFSADYTITDSSVEEGDPANNRRTLIVEMRVEASPPPPTEIPWWVIAVPIVVAVLLLVAVFVVLYILGFFKRKRPKDEAQALVDEGGPVEGEGEGEEGAGSEEIEDNDPKEPEPLEDSAADDTVTSGGDLV